MYVRVHLHCITLHSLHSMRAIRSSNENANVNCDVPDHLVHAHACVIVTVNVIAYANVFVRVHAIQVTNSAKHRNGILICMQNSNPAIQFVHVDVPRHMRMNM